MTDLPPLDELVSLRGRVAVVTGAARGIGAAIAGRLAEAGADVVVADLDAEAAEAGSAAIGSNASGAVLAAPVDITDSASVDAVGDLALETFGRLDIWVNNAGIFPTTGPLVEVDDEFVDRMLAVNVRGTVAGARTAAHRMPDGGVIVNVSSTTGLRGSVGVGAYGASKFAVEGISRTLALELAPAGVRVLAVAPWIVDTPGVREQMDGLAAVGRNVDSLLADNPLGRAGTPDDIARVVLFAASDLAGWMTGSTVVVDAGRTAH